MLSIMWEKGLRGKVWRILYKLNQNLKASIKTRHGKTKKIAMSIGGRQGSRLTGRMFGKLMDTLAEEIEEKGDGFKLTIEFVIGVLLWVDDVVSCVEGEDKQKDILKTIDNFAKNHKLKWGKDKCRVMKIGKHHTSQTEWDLGDLKIANTDTYTYLGDVITCDGKNTKNIEARKAKLKAATIHINTIAESEVLKKVETSVLLELHEKVNIAKLLTNSESWDLLIGEKKEIDTAEIQALKSLFDLPIKTPNAAILYTFGTLSTSLRIDKKQLFYLHKLVTRNVAHWTLKILKTQAELNIGWFKNIKGSLEKYQLPNDLEQIK